MKYLFLSFLLIIATATTIVADDVVQLPNCRQLKLILDARLTPEVIAREWATGNEREGTPARLELQTCKSQVLDSMILLEPPYDAPMATIDHTPIRGTLLPTYLISIDLTVGFGAYNGPTSFLIQVNGNSLQRVVEALSPQGKLEPFYLTYAVRSGWEKLSLKKRDEFLSVVCLPPKNEKYTTRYSRYFFKNKRWHVRHRTKSTCYEMDQEFPDRREFP